MSMDSQSLFEILVRENASMLTVFLKTMVRDTAAVDDLFQETMMAAWKNIHRFDRSKPFGPWLRGIASNCVLAHRRQEIKKIGLYDPAMIHHLETRFQILDQQPGDTFEEKIRFLQECLQELPALLREAIEYRYSKLFSLIELAFSLGISNEAAKKRLQRARAYLLQCMMSKLFRKDSQHEPA